MAFDEKMDNQRFLDFKAAIPDFRAIDLEIDSNPCVDDRYQINFVRKYDHPKPGSWIGNVWCANPACSGEQVDLIDVCRRAKASFVSDRVEGDGGRYRMRYPVDYLVPCLGREGHFLTPTNERPKCDNVLRISGSIIFDEKAG